MTHDLNEIIAETLAGRAHLTAAPGHLPPAFAVPAASAATFQWPWDIASAGAGHLKNHGAAVNALVDGGNKAVSAPSGSGIVAAVSGGPTNPANTNKLLNDGLFSQALNTVRADRLLRTVFIGWATGAQIGFVGGGGGSGVAYDIIDHSDLAAVSFGSFNLGIGGRVGGGLVLGAMTAQPHQLNFSTCVWQFGASMAVSVAVMVIMNSDDLSLVGFGLTLGGGVGLSSSTGYGKISAS